MECNAKDPTRYLPRLRPLIFHGNSSNIPCKCIRLLTRGPVMIPPDFAGIPGSADEGKENVFYGRGWIGCRAATNMESQKNRGVTSAKVFQDTGSWLRDEQTKEGTEETSSGRYCKLFQPFRNYRSVIIGIDATGENPETIENEGGVKISELRDR